MSAGREKRPWKHVQSTEVHARQSHEVCATQTTCTYSTCKISLRGHTPRDATGQEIIFAVSAAQTKGVKTKVAG